MAAHRRAYRRRIYCRFTYRRSPLYRRTAVPPDHECRFPLFLADYLVFTRLNAGRGDSTMCPNCLTQIAMALGGAGSAIVPSLLLGAGLAAAGLRFRTVRAAETIPSNQETAS